MTRKQRAAISGAALSLVAALSGVAAAGERPEVAQIDWDDKLSLFQIDKEEFFGQRLTVRCPALGPKAPAAAVHGSGVYPSDNPICPSALHAGKIGVAGGEVTVQLNPGAAAYEGSERNGVESASRPATARSIVFVGGGDDVEADAVRAKFRPLLDWEARFTQTGLAQLNLIGQRFAFTCPKAPERMLARRIVGTDRYAYASVVCQAAVHAGVITPEGGDVLVQMEPKDLALIGSIRNGVETVNGPSGERSLTFVAAGQQ